MGRREKMIGEKRQADHIRYEKRREANRRESGTGRNKVDRRKFSEVTAVCQASARPARSVNSYEHRIMVVSGFGSSYENARVCGAVAEH